MTKPPEEHAENWDLRHQDFNDNDLLYDVYSVMRQSPSPTPKYFFSVRHREVRG